MVDWAGLLPDILFLISSSITEAEDFLSFRSVCSTWRHTALRSGSTRSLNPFRWHVFRPNSLRLYKIYSLRKNKIYEVSLPEVTKETLYLSHLTNDWFFTKSLKHETRLVHPFSRQVISLPPFANYVKKVVLSSSPTFSPKDFIVLVLSNRGGRLYFCKSKDREWTTIRSSSASFADVTYCKGQIYALDKQGVVYAFNVGGCNPIAKVPIGPLKPWPWYPCTSFYLVGSIDNHDCVFIVVKNSKSRDEVDDGKYYRDNYDYTVYEVDLSGKGGWKKINDLGSRTMFLNTFEESFCIENSNFSSGIIEYHDVNLLSDQFGHDAYSVTKSAKKIEISTCVCNFNDGIKRQFFHPTESLSFFAHH